MQPRGRIQADIVPSTTEVDKLRVELESQKKDGKLQAMMQEQDNTIATLHC